MLLMDLAVGVATFSCAYILTPYVLSMLVKGELQHTNYRNEIIPVGAGILLFLATLPVLAILYATPTIANTMSSVRILPALVVTIIGFSLLGLLDDTVGNGTARGFGGHLRALLCGEITTGFIKAIYGGILAIVIVKTAPLTGWFLLAVLVVALSANTINLFDLRPGRALKVFFVGYIFTMIFTGSTGGPLLVVPAAAAGLVPWDLRAQAMLGDTGANVLGATLGLFFVTHFTPVAQVVLCVGLLGLHLYAEKFSLTQLIDQQPALRWLDMLGRR